MHNIEAINKRIEGLLVIKQAYIYELLFSDCDDNGIFEKLKEITEELVNLSNMKNEEPMNKFNSYSIEEIKNVLTNEQENFLEYQEEADKLEKRIASIPKQIEELHRELRKLIEYHRHERSMATASQIKIEQAERELRQRVTPAF